MQQRVVAPFSPGVPVSHAMKDAESPGDAFPVHENPIDAPSHAAPGAATHDGSTSEGTQQ
jgi:hypothetical protein